MTERSVVVEAVEKSWSRQTCGTPELWHQDNPAKGHCDVSAFVAWEHLGGELVLGEVHHNGDFQEHHYWNRIDGSDIDLTRSQFQDGEVITEKEVLSEDFLRSNQESMREELKARIASFRQAVDRQLAAS